jgi:hypothetical protein
VPLAVQRAYFNDPDELVYPLAIAREVLVRLTRQSTWLRTQKLLKGAASTLESFAAAKQWYVACFSTKGDLLSQWRAYCPNGGYSLGFDGSTLQSLLVAPKRSIYPPMLGPVDYDPASQLARVRKTIQRWVKGWEW